MPRRWMTYRAISPPSAIHPGSIGHPVVIANPPGTQPNPAHSNRIHHAKHAPSTLPTSPPNCKQQFVGLLFHHSIAMISIWFCAVVCALCVGRLVLISDRKQLRKRFKCVLAGFYVNFVVFVFHFRLFYFLPFFVFFISIQNRKYEK